MKSQLWYFLSTSQLWKRYISVSKRWKELSNPECTLLYRVVVSNKCRSLFLILLSDSQIKVHRRIWYFKHVVSLCSKNFSVYTCHNAWLHFFLAAASALCVHVLYRAKSLSHLWTWTFDIYSPDPLTANESYATTEIFTKVYFLYAESSLALFQCKSLQYFKYMTQKKSILMHSSYFNICEQRARYEKQTWRRHETDSGWV